MRNVFLIEVPLVGVTSRKVHGAMAYDINLPLIGTPGVECRSGGGNGYCTLIFSFANTTTDVDNASVTSGTESVSSRMIAVAPHNYVVNLIGVSNAQRVTVTLTKVNDAAGKSSSSVPISMGVLIGDTSGNGILNATDVSQIGPGRVVDASNFRQDVTVNGFINSSDVSTVKLQSGTALP